MPHILLAQWPLQITSGILGLLTLLLLARLALELAFGARSQIWLVRSIVRLTNPVVRAVGAITPRLVPGALVTLCAIFWILTVRMALALLGTAMAMRRVMG